MPRICTVFYGIERTNRFSFWESAWEKWVEMSGGSVAGQGGSGCAAREKSRLR